MPPLLFTWGIRGTVVARWNTGQQVERSVLHQGHNKIYIIRQGIPLPSIALQCRIVA